MRAFLLTISVVVLLAGCGTAHQPSARPGAAPSSAPADQHATTNPNQGIGLVRRACAEYGKSVGSGGATIDAVVANSTAHRQRAVDLASRAEDVNTRWVGISKSIHRYASKKVAFGNELDSNGVGTPEGGDLITAVGEAGIAFEAACAEITL